MTKNEKIKVANLMTCAKAIAKGHYGIVGLLDAAVKDVEKLLKK